MHSLRRLRSKEVLRNIEDLLAHFIAMDRYHQLRPFESTASTPSLRASEPLSANSPTAMSQDGSGNVKVVVRVRQFIPRGMLLYSRVRECSSRLCLQSSMMDTDKTNNIPTRAGYGCAMHRPYGPRRAIDHSPSAHQQCIQFATAY
jgi:hypothetical protein